MKILKNIILILILLFSVIYTQAQCNGTQTFTLTPPPVNNQYPVGTVVTVCYTMNGWIQFNNNWIDGFKINLGPGWTNLTPSSPPINCNGGGGQWIWFQTPRVFGSNTIGPGWYFDLHPDGNPTNDYGDNGTTCLWTFCFNVTVAQSCTAQNLLIQVTAGADGTWGSWTQTGCPTIPIRLFNGNSLPVPLIPVSQITHN